MQQKKNHAKQHAFRLSWRRTAPLLTRARKATHAMQLGSLAALGLASLLPTKADAAILNTNDPTPSFPHVGENVTINLNAVNDDTGAIYNSAELNVFKELAEGLYALPANQTNYGSMLDLMNDWSFGISNNAPGNVHNGWNFQKQNDGSISIGNIGGVPDLSYDLWNSTSGSNTQAYTLIIPGSQLDFTGVAGFDPTKAGIVRSSELSSDMFVGFEGGAANISHSADGHFYQVQIPEPSAYGALFALAAAGAALYRRRQRLRQF